MAAVAPSTTTTEFLPDAIAAWSSLSDVLHQMNETLVAAKQQREQSLLARKVLAETTKQFKRSVKNAEVAAHSLSVSPNDPTVASLTVHSVEALSKECRGTIRAYQEEIDNLTRRGKAAESSCATAVATLADRPNPVPLLEAAHHEIAQQKLHVQQVLQTVESVNRELEAAELKNRQYQEQLAVWQKDSNSGKNNNAANQSSTLSNEERDELVQLRTEVAEYEVEFRSLKNQDITIRKLEDKIHDLQTAGAQQLERSIQQAREELAVTEGRRAAAALEREAVLRAKVETLELQRRSERAGREATQNGMLEADEGLSRREAAWEAQRQILVDDNERVREELRTVARERDELRMRVAATTGKAPVSVGVPTGDVQDLLLERNAYEAEVSRYSSMQRICGIATTHEYC